MEPTKKSKMPDIIIDIQDALGIYISMPLYSYRQCS